MPPLQHVVVFTAADSLADDHSDQDLDDRHQHSEDVFTFHTLHILLLFG